MRTSKGTASDGAWRRGLIDRLEALESEFGPEGSPKGGVAAQPSREPVMGVLPTPSRAEQVPVDSLPLSRTEASARDAQAAHGPEPTAGALTDDPQLSVASFQKALEDALRSQGHDAAIGTIDAALVAVTHELGKIEPPPGPAAASPPARAIMHTAPEKRLSIQQSDTLEELKSAIESARVATSAAISPARRTAFAIGGSIAAVGAAWGVYFTTSPLHQATSRADRDSSVITGSAVAGPKLFEAQFKPNADEPVRIIRAKAALADFLTASPARWDVRRVDLETAGGLLAQGQVEIIAGATTPDGGFGLALPLDLRWAAGVATRELSVLVWNVPAGGVLSPAVLLENGSWRTSSHEISRLRIALPASAGEVMLLVDAFDPNGEHLARAAVVLMPGNGASESNSRERSPAPAGEQIAVAPVVPEPVAEAAKPAPRMASVQPVAKSDGGSLTAPAPAQRVRPASLQGQAAAVPRDRVGKQAGAPIAKAPVKAPAPVPVQGHQTHQKARPTGVVALGGPIATDRQVRRVGQYGAGQGAAPRPVAEPIVVPPPPASVVGAQPRWLPKPD